jgi:hypothetical protein
LRNGNSFKVLKTSATMRKNLVGRLRNDTQSIGNDNLRQQDQAARNIEGGVALPFENNGDLAAAATTRAVDESREFF